MKDVMTNGIVFALLSLVFAGLNDVVFKRYSRKDRSRGAFIFGIGVVWSLLQIASMAVTETPISLENITLAYGLAAGVLLTLSNILLLEALTHISASLGSTIYRLNTIGVAVLAYLVLSEPLGGMKLFGIFLGIVAVFMLYKSDSATREERSQTWLFLLMAVMASLVRASYGVVTKAGIIADADPQTMLLACAVSWVVGGALYARLREGRFKLTAKKMGYAAVSGLLVFLIVAFLMLAVKYGEASTVIPIANMSFIVAMLISVATRIEKITPKKIASIVLASIGIIFLTLA
jgi:drug/metabolite transporter (DMT)-like permease